VPDTVATKKRWTDLQLPLYRELVRGELGPGVLTGYILLPGALGASAFSLWEDYSDALHASALACAQAVIARLREGIFWPPGSLAGGYQDDLAGLLLDDPAATMEPPPAPWRAAP
jgi:ATP-dependent helicase/nuclease subunit B